MAARGIRRYRHRRTRRPHRRCPGPPDHLRAQDPARRRFPHAGHRPGLRRSRQVVAMTADTAATAAPDPEPQPGSGSGADADDTPAARAHFRAWEDQLAAEDTCSHPVQLRSRTDMIDTTTGELAPVYGHASVGCGNRRETVCPACSATYKRDARQLVRAGLGGGKGIPETITGHPCVFATL